MLLFPGAISKVESGTPDVAVKVDRLPGLLVDDEMAAVDAHRLLRSWQLMSAFPQRWPPNSVTVSCAKAVPGQFEA